VVADVGSIAAFETHGRRSDAASAFERQASHARHGDSSDDSGDDAFDDLPEGDVATGA
jgi:hypothetical protein